MANASGSDTPDTSEQPQYLTAKDAEALFAKVANSAITSHFKRLDFGKMVGDAFAVHQAKAVEDDPNADRQVAAGAKSDPEVARLRREMEAQRKLLEASTQRAEQAEHARRNERALSELRSHIAKRVRPEAVETLTKAFRGDLKFDESGEALLIGADGQPASIADVIDAFAKSKDAELFRPAPSQGGAGTPRSASRGSADYMSKPRDQWSEADTSAFFQAQVAKNAALGG